MKIINHRLHHDDGTPYAFRASPHVGNVIQPRWLVIHYTASGSASEAINWFANPRSKVSAHIVIARDGTITQCVPFNRRASHAGVSTWQGVSGLNRHTIGIELDGFGYLGPRGPGRWKFRGTSIPDADVVVGTHRFGTPAGGWPRYPQAQLNAAMRLSKLLVKEYRLQDVVGHDDISPGRKQDPGPAFPMARFRAECMERPAGGAPGLRPLARFRVTHRLNVRGGPAATHPTVLGSPLPAGTVVRGVEDRAGWKRVTAEASGVAGWVSARFLEAMPTELFTVTAGSLNVRAGPGSSNATVPGSPLRKDAIVQALQEGDGWRRVVSLVPPRVTGWVSARFLKPSVVALANVNQPADA